MVMDVKSVENDTDLRLVLLAGDPIFTDNIEIKPHTLREIKDIGYTEYMRNLGMLLLDKEHLTNGDKSLNKYSIVELVLLSKSDFLIKTFAECLAMFLRESLDDLLITPIGYIFNGKQLDPQKAKIVDKDTYNDIVQIIKYHNCIINPSESYTRPNPKDEIAKAILDKFKKANEIVAKQKAAAREESNIDFSDIVSAVSTKSNGYNKHTVWDLTVYQLYDEYKRLDAINGYEFNIMAMLQGAKIDDLKHWSARIES